MTQGECTITLQDVAILLGLLCEGVPVVRQTCAPWPKMCLWLLGHTPPADKIRDQRSSMKWLDKTFSFINFPPDPTNNDIEHFTLAYILKLIGGNLILISRPKRKHTRRWIDVTGSASDNLDHPFHIDEGLTFPKFVYGSGIEDMAPPKSVYDGIFGGFGGKFGNENVSSNHFILKCWPLILPVRGSAMKDPLVLGVPVVEQTRAPWPKMCLGLLGHTPLASKIKAQCSSMKWLDKTFSFTNFPPYPRNDNSEHFT
ncbi:serine/threonine-protein phosphatase 7 long form-like protein [Senna tora]|uniref:Serine/threonine-protein phosphatase 7 long form-like protein n=1 Tax=Senna tora TaxID=362788 RepID=A0A834WLL9_9FABA|nr:serine/threonine-protein phosphatase 7 long form-like protein [Senna tora]